MVSPMLRVRTQYTQSLTSGTVVAAQFRGKLFQSENAYVVFWRRMPCCQRFFRGTEFQRMASHPWTTSQSCTDSEEHNDKPVSVPSYLHPSWLELKRWILCASPCVNKPSGPSLQSLTTARSSHSSKCEAFIVAFPQTLPASTS